MSTPLNVHLLTPEELVKYPTPETELEKALTEAIKGLLASANTAEDDYDSIHQQYKDERHMRERYESFYVKILEHFEFVTNRDWFAPEPYDERLLEAIQELMTGERPAPKQVDTIPKEPPTLSSGFVHDCID